jgi:hypothetical protein
VEQEGIDIVVPAAQELELRDTLALALAEARLVGPKWFPR